MSEEINAGLNRAKPYQLMLFPLNNGATNVYFVLVLSYVLNFGSGVLEMAPIVGEARGGYNTAGFFATLAPVGVTISIVLTALAVIGIWDKDQPKYFGVGGGNQEKIKVSEYVQIIKSNQPMQQLMVAGAGCKLALAIATHTAVLCMLYGSMMGNYDGLYLPMMMLGYVFSAPFFVLTIRTSQKHGQKASLMRYVAVAFACYVGVLALLLWRQGEPRLEPVHLYGQAGREGMTLQGRLSAARAHNTGASKLIWVSKPHEPESVL